MKKVLLRGLLFIMVLSITVLQSQELTVQTDSGKHVLSRPEIEALPHLKVSASEHSNSVNFEGASLKSVLEKAGVKFGQSMKGKRLASCLLVEASDGYRVIFALPELDPAFTDKQIVLAFQRDGKPLGEKWVRFASSFRTKKPWPAGSAKSLW